MRRSGTLLAASAAVAAMALVVVLRDREPPALNGAPLQPLDVAPAISADTLAADLLARVRGLDAVACELATRAVRSRGSWGDPHQPGASEDPQVAAIVRWALDDGGSEAVPVLGAGLADPDPCVRRLAAIRLGRIEDPSAATWLRRALESANGAEREAAALGLGISDDAEAVPALVRHLAEDESPRVRRAAAWALGAID